ncbi:MAG TPA: hypothetical protein PLI53_11785 [Geobacteraceae bacterium]|nr:hypothetical protein [Geobacteraceae bacterium]
MEYRIDINNEKRYVEVTTQGVASSEGFISFISELLKPSYMALGYNLLVEISELDTRYLVSADVGDIVDFLERHRADLPQKKHAIVAATPLAFGFARMYQIMAEDYTPMTTRVFGFREQAENWLLGEDE